jgi:hypothetical protein
MVFNELNTISLEVLIQVANLVIKSLSHGRRLDFFIKFYKPEKAVIESSKQIIKSIETAELNNVANIDIKVRSNYIVDIENVLSSKIKEKIVFDEEKTSKIFSKIGIEI